MSRVGRIARRLGTYGITLAIVTLIVFLLTAAFPGDPLEDEADHRLPPEYRHALRAQLHLDDPVGVRFARWVTDLAHGDLGVSSRERRPVATILRERLPVSIALNGTAVALIILLAAPLGIAGAWKPGSRWDRIARFGTTALYAVPVFWTALLLQGLFAVRLAWLPLFGTSSAVGISAWSRAADLARHLVLPVTCVALGGLAYVSRFVRTALLDATGGDGGRAIRALGATALRYVTHHGLGQAAVPLLTLAGFLIPRVVSGSLLVEEIFNLPGIGTLMFDSVMARDVPVIAALTLVTGIVTLGAVAAADLLAAWADPRVRRAA